MTVKTRKLATVAPQCVACGCCERVCPVGAIKVERGSRAVVIPGLCIGCGRCMRECPASVITVGERGIAL